MSKTDTEQKSVLVRQHARMAMGEKLDGQSMKGSTAPTKQSGGLSQAKKK
jgi:hypothetical protein